MFQLTIGKRINLLIIVLLIGVAAPIIFLNTQNYRSDMRNQLINVQLPEVSNNILNTIDKQIMEVSRGLDLAVHSPILQNWVRKGEPNNGDASEGNLETIYALLESIIKSYNTLGANFVSAGTGQYTDLLEGKRDYSYKISEKDGWFFGFRDSYAPVGITAYVNDDKWGTKSFINRRVDVNGKFAGLISVSIDIQDFAKKLSTTIIGKKGLTFIVDDKATVRFFHDQKRINTPLNSTLPEYKTHWQTIAQQETYSFSYHDATGDERFVITRKIPILDWYLIIEASGKELFGSMKTSIYTSIAISLTLTILGVLVALYMVRSLLLPLRATAEYAESVSNGKFDHELKVKGNDEIGTLASSLRQMVTSIQGQIAEAKGQEENALKQMHLAEKAVKESEHQQELTNAILQRTLEGAEKAATIADSLSQIASTLGTKIDTTNTGADEQYTNLQAMSQAMHHMTSMFAGITDNANKTATSVGEARTMATTGKNSVIAVINAVNKAQGITTHMSDSMRQLTEQAQNINSILNTITDIADQTNLLALNAAIEAARAGDAGRGFAVVADEVRQLAEKTMLATRDVAAALTGIQKTTQENYTGMADTTAAVQQAAELAETSGEALTHIVDLSNQNAAQVSDIANAVVDLEQNNIKITSSLEQVNSVTLNTREGMRESFDTVATLIQQAQSLDRLIVELKGD